MDHLLTVNDVIARTGIRRSLFSIPGSSLVDGVQVKEAAVNEATNSRRYLVLMIPKSISGFIRIIPNLSSDRFRQGSSAREYVGALAQTSKEMLAAHTFVVVSIETPLGLDMFVEINTDHPELVKAIEAAEKASAGGGGRPPVAMEPYKLGVNVILVGEDRKTATSERFLRLQLLPMRQMPIYSGYAALDFGNTSSTLVLSDTNQRDEFEVVPADVRDKTTASGSPVQTALLITAIKPPAKAGGFFHYKATIGSQSLEISDTGCLVLGAKRLLSDRKKQAADGDMVAIGNEIHRIPTEDPAEVYISQMLQGMFFHRQSRPQSVAVTCPTTFTVSEVARLKRTVARSFLRAEGRSASNFREGMTEAYVPLVIDEATAAAFYFAYRDFIDGPGRMPAFRYLYPNGLHMLLYDCGGGTTDIALVRLEARAQGHVEISVLGRAGHRQFGGDFITLQVFRLLKVKLAAAKRRIPELPKIPGQLEAFLRTHQASADMAVPTMFDRAQQQNDDARQRRETTLWLWQLAESMKKRLSIKGTKTVKPDGSNSEISERDLLGWIAARVVLPEELENVDDLADRLEVSRQEVDALVDREIDRTIEYANDLIRDCMRRIEGQAGPAGHLSPLEVPEVDRVYVVGNASRYPRIKDRLLDPEHGLRVRYLEERLAEIRAEDFKNSVAKGAVVALRLRDMSAGGQISWDDEFMHKLPFDLVSETLSHAGDNVLFRQGDRYSRTMRAWREIPPDARTGQPTVQRIRLDRRWPGEAKTEPCLIFQFDEPIAGRFAIRYDEERQAFVMHPDRKGGEDELLAVAEPFDQAAYLAPPQSGTI